MLDKSVPYAGFYMRREAGKQLPSFPLPDGYGFVLFSDGDEENWAGIEASVLEFDNEFAALLHFKKEYIPYRDELGRRCVFVVNETGEKIATSMAWWRVVENKRRAWLSWVAVKPEHQGLGLGKAVVSEGARLLAVLNGDVDFYLSTQTWSYKAVGIYNLFGFTPVNEKALYNRKGDNYEKAMRILKKIRTY